MVYGGHVRIRADGTQLGRNIYFPPSKDPYADLLAGNFIGMHATVLYRRDVLLAVGGFDEVLRRCEDYDVYLRLARTYSIASHPKIVAEYRWHGGNMSRDTTSMLRAALEVHDRHREQTGARERAWRTGRSAWKSWYTSGQQKKWDREQENMALRLVGLARTALTRMKRRLRNGRLHWLASRVLGVWPPPLGSVRFGELGTTKPVSLNFGWDRGTPIDRYYVENFLQACAADIQGRVLEVADDAYSSRFGGSRITRQDILHLHAGNSKATLVGDLTHPGVLPDDAFDCIVLTQTLQFIFDLPSAAGRLYSSLRRGGVLLLTVPGITAIDRGEWGPNWCWSFSPIAVSKIFEPWFGKSALTIEAYGNVFSATAFLQGFALEEVEQSKLDTYDPAYPVVVTLRAVKL
jgi:SAM-dependent methyltransferase